jgi:hypothetical protein
MNVESKGCRGRLSRGRGALTLKVGEVFHFLQLFRTDEASASSGVPCRLLGVFNGGWSSQVAVAPPEYCTRDLFGQRSGLESFCQTYEFCYALRVGPSQGSRGRLFISWRLTPGVNSQPIKILESARNGGGCNLFVLACGLVATHSESACAFCSCRREHPLL